MAKRILIVDDEPDICEILRFNLEMDGFDVMTVESADDGQKIVDALPVDLILLDVMMTPKSGFEWAKELKSVPRTAGIPIIFCTAKTLEEDLLLGFALGSDDYICKPFDVDEVVLRIEAVLRRIGGAKSPEAETLRYKELVLLPEEQRVYLGEEEIRCTSMEYAILEIMLKNPGKVFSKRNLFESVTGEDYMSEDNTMNVHMSNLRKKIGKVTEEAYIETVYGMGYRMAK